MFWQATKSLITIERFVEQNDIVPKHQINLEQYPAISNSFVEWVENNLISNNKFRRISVQVVLQNLKTNCSIH
jgi:hypothetical protein